MKLSYFIFIGQLTTGSIDIVTAGQLAGEVQDRTRAAERMKRLPIPVVAVGAAAPRPHEH